MNNVTAQPVSATPSVLATIFATSILSGVVGYYIGLGSTLSLHRPRSRTTTDADTDTDCPPDSDDEQPEAANDFSDIPGDCKLVLVVRPDLKMRGGKIAAQCSHATLACFQSVSKTCPALCRRWEKTGQAKIALRGDEGGEDELVVLQAQAVSLGVTAKIIRDAGRTQIAAVGGLYSPYFQAFIFALQITRLISICLDIREVLLC